MIRSWIKLPPRIQPHGLERMHDGLPALDDRPDADTETGEEQPDDTDDDPAGEELLGEDIRAAVHGPRPEDDEGGGEEEGHGAGDDGGAFKLRLFGGGGLFAAVALAGYELEVDVGGLGEVGVVAAADQFHRFPVVLLPAEGEGEDGHEEDRGEQGGHVAGEHGIVGSRAGDGKVAAGLGGCHEPRDQRADESQDRGEGGRDPVLAGPEQGERGGEDGAGDDASHHQVEVAHADAAVEETG